MTYVQDAPFCIQIELVQGCSVSVPRSDGTKGLCDFCGINGIREAPGNFKYMEISTLEKLCRDIKQAGWNPRIELAMFGEPSMHPELLLCIATIKKTLPKQQLMLTSNGTGFAKRVKIVDAFKAGLDILALDDYYGANIVSKVVENNSEIIFEQYPLNKEANPHRRRKAKELPTAIIISDLSTNTKGTHAKLYNHTGIGMPPEPNFRGRCANPFRELSVRYDGLVNICCQDVRGEFPIGNINTMFINDIWQHERFMLARRMLLQKDRLVRPCQGCNWTGKRVGLLPDKFGKVKLPPLTEEEVAKLKTMPITASYPVVLRKWEKSNVSA